MNALDEDGDGAPHGLHRLGARARARRLQTNIKARPADSHPIISANAPAFESYGWRPLIAPTCASVRGAVHIALNHLLRDPTAHLTMGGAALVC